MLGTLPCSFSMPRRKEALRGGEEHLYSSPERVDSGITRELGRNAESQVPPRPAGREAMPPVLMSAKV